MTNVKMEVVGNKLVIEIDLEERNGLSSTGKSITVASTGGNKKIAGTEVFVGVNAYVKAPQTVNA